MHLGDAIEFNHSDYSVSAEAIPMINVMCLSNIWLPSHLFRNQRKFIDTNLNKPGIFRTLEKPVITDCFTIYSESNLQNDESENFSFPEDDSSDDFSHADMLDLLNDYSPKVDNINVSSKIENSILYSESPGSNQLQNSSCEQLTIGNTCDINTNFDPHEEESSVAKETASLAKNTKQYNPSNTNYITFIKTLSDSLRDSLEEIYNSEDEEVNQKNAIMFREETCNHADFDSISDHSSSILSQQFEKIEIESQYNAIKSETEQSGISECSNHIAVVKPSDCFINSEIDGNFNVDNLDFKAGETQNPCIEGLIKYPIAYQRPAIEETVGKQRYQKERKKKKALKKNILLNAFLPEDNCVADYKEPLVDEFYEHVMRKQHYKSYASEYPSLYKESQISYNGSEGIYPSEEQTPEMKWGKDPRLTMIDVTGDQTISTGSNEIKIKEEEPDLKNATTIVIENIPPYVTEEQLRSILLGYGELKKFSLEPCGEFLKAKVKLICDVDWIIECLNGNQPFGTTSEVLKCYKLC